MIEALAGIVGPDAVLVDPDLRAGYQTDWTRRYSGPALAVVRPSTTEEVAEVVRLCADKGVPVVPQGGNTGLVGGGVPGPGGPAPVVLSLQRLAEVRVVDTEAGQVTVEAGVTLGALDRVLAGTGWEFGVDLGARDSATLGGMIATNAGGTRVLRYGSMRQNVLGVEAVLGDGSTFTHLDGLVKDNTGYDLAGLLCGSEGTLGVVTAARLRLVPAWPDRLAVAVACEGWGDAVHLASVARRTVDGLDGLEAIDRSGAVLAREQLGVPAPVGEPPVTLFLVWAGRGDPPDTLVDLVADREHVVGPPRRLLEARERQAEAIARTGIPHKLDVTVPVARLEAFARAAAGVVPASARLHLFGHLGDGNLHVNVVGPDPDDADVDDAVLGLVARYGGSISAEHGIGRAKARWLHLCRSAEEIAAMRAVKRALDPYAIMNPGVIFD